MPVLIKELDFAVECTSTDFSFGEYFVYLNKVTGELFHDSADSEDEVPDDVDDSNKYILVPTKKDLGLGRPLVIQFISECVPEKLDEVYFIFSRKGAYQKYKSMLSSIEKLDDWYAYEAEQQKLALREWCKDNDIECT